MSNPSAHSAIVRIMFCSALILFCVLLPAAGQNTVAASSPAQAPPADGLPSEDTLASWLHSGDQRMVAWGARDALVTHDRNLIPDLLNLASQWQPLSIRVQAYVHVVLPGAKLSRLSMVTGGSYLLPPERPREDWPVTGQYALSKQKGDGDTLLVAGIDPIYATRKPSAQDLGDGPNMAWHVSLGPEERLRLIAEMLSIPPEKIPWQIRLDPTIEFLSLPQFDNDLAAFIEDQQDRYRATVDALATRDLIAPSETEPCLPKLILQLSDERGNGGVPIPKRSDLPLHVEWSSLPF